MSIELKIPEVGESITEVEIGGWLKNQGDHVEKDESVVSLESEKATVELPAPESGTIGRILKQKGETAKVGEVIGYLEKDGQEPAGRGQKAEGRGEKSEVGLKEDVRKKAGKPDAAIAAPQRPEATRQETEVRSQEVGDRSQAPGPSTGREVSGLAGGREEEIVPM